MTRRQRPGGNERGFTLIEILVVVVVVAVMAAVVSMALAGGGGERQLEREADKLQALLGYACEHAEIGGKPVGLGLSRGGYVFSVQDGEQWKLFNQGELRERRWPGVLRAALSRDGKVLELAENGPEKPQVVCFASGELTPFRLELGLADAGLRWRLDGLPDGSVGKERRDAAY